jgi:trans-2,3-dihydro-3-hydroxyanthranilate isomerase
MPVYPLIQVDAFTDHPLGGNPCAVVFGADDLTPDQMQAVAREMNLSETAFVRRSDQADFAVRYFTPSQTHLFCTQGVTPAGDTFARHFAPPPYPFEDPFTGSASGGMGAFLWRYGLIGRPTFTAEQGHWMGRPGLGIVEVTGEREAIETVRVGGGAITVLRGELIL